MVKGQFHFKYKINTYLFYAVIVALLLNKIEVLINSKMRRHSISILFLPFYLNFYLTEAAKILSLFPMPSASHVTLGHELSIELAKKGHEIVMITPYPKNPQIKNFTEIYLKDLAEEMFKEKSNFFEMDDMSILQQLIYCHYLGYMVIEGTFKDPQIQKLLKSKESFDAVIMDQFYNEALLGIADYFKAPMILLSSLESPMWTHNKVGNPDYYSYMPNAYLRTSNRMNFFNRFWNTVINLSEEIYRLLIAYPYHNKVLHQFIPTAPHLNDLMYNVSLIFVNTHISIGDATPKVPNMIDIGGMHVKKMGALSNEIKTILDNSPEGVIYFSLGSNLKPSVLPIEKRDAILKVFSKLNVTILWKWDENDLPNQPKNVIISKWFSQVDVLAHPNVKAFISHGGLMSTIESVYFGVPIIGIPVYADQSMNIARVVANEYGLRIKYKELDEEKLTLALNEILNNPKYKENAERRSKLMQDRPLKPMDTAVYWVEYIIRHRGAPHLRTAAMELNWWQIYLIDVMAFALFIIICFVYLLSFIFNALFAKTNKKEKAH